MSAIEVSSLNSMAVKLSLASKFQEAASVLSRGLRDIKEHCLEGRPQSEQPSGPNKSPVIYQTCVSVPDEIDQVSPANLYVFYPVLFSACPPCHNINSEMFYDMIVAVMMHNLAVLHHRAAMSNGSSHQLKFALRLYQQSAKTLRMWTDASSCAPILLIVVANMAQIHSHFCNQAEAQRSFECAFGVLLQVQDESPSDNELYDGVFAHFSLCGHVSTHASAA